MRLRIYGDLLRLITLIRPDVERIARHDADLARQIRRAMSSGALNMAEAYRGRGRNRPARYQLSLGEMSEAKAATEVAVAWGYIEPISDEAVDLFEKVIATLVRLSRS